MSHSDREAADVADLIRTAVPGATVVGADAQPGVGRVGWNAAPGPRPAAAVACRTVADVVGVLEVVRDHDLPVSVMGGGIDPFQRYVREGGVVLDLARMNGVTVDHAVGEVTVGGGATVADLFGALPDDRVVPTGTVTYAGLAGLTMGGGYGLLTGRLGLTLDQLTRVEIVLPDGRIVNADQDHEPDIFWAVRGGGSDVGVVTSLTYRMASLEKVSVATIAVDLDHAVSALLTVQQLLDQYPDELSITSSFVGAQDGRPGLVLAACWAGEGNGAAALARLRSLRGAAVLAEMEGPYRNALRADARWPFGLCHVGSSRSVARLTDGVAQRLVECARLLPSPESALFLHDFHGTPARVAHEATAFPLRRDHFVVGIVASYSPAVPDQRQRHQAWVDMAAARLEPVALPGGYINFLGPADEARARQFYGDAADRLRCIRRSADPTGRFAGGTGFFDSAATVGRCGDGPVDDAKR